jgi:hypothetical protein
MGPITITEINNRDPGSDSINVSYVRSTGDEGKKGRGGKVESEMQRSQETARPENIKPFLDFY